MYRTTLTKLRLKLETVPSRIRQSFQEKMKVELLERKMTVRCTILKQNKLSILLYG